MSTIAQYRGTGKRKTSVARVILRPGDGTTWFNGRTIEEYFPRQAHRTIAMAPLQIAGVAGTYDIRVRVHGGGPSGQAGAVRHGIARALVESDPELRVPLKRAGTPQDVANLVHFLATGGSYITGQIIRLDGGRSIT